MITTNQKRSASKISFTDDKVHYKNAELIANTDGKVMGTAKVVFDEHFTTVNHGSWFFVHYKDAPIEVGWYKVDKKDRLFTKIAEQDADKLEWDECLYVSKDAIKAVKERQPLALFLAVPAHYDALVLDAEYRTAPTGRLGCYEDDWVAEVVQVEPSHFAAAPAINAVKLRQ